MEFAFEGYRRKWSEIAPLRLEARKADRNFYKAKLDAIRERAQQIVMGGRAATA